MTFAVCFKILLYAACSLVGISIAFAACKPEGGRVPPAMVNDFLRKPEIILSEDATSKRGARELRASISHYAVASPASIEAIRSILQSTTPQQRAAIGEGLYEAVDLCRATDPATASRIEAAIKSISDRDVMQAYRLAENLSAHSIGNPQPKIISGFTSAKRSAHVQGLIEEPSPTSPGKF